MNKRNAGLLALGSFTLIALLHFFHYNSWVSFDPVVLQVARWFFVTTLMIFAWFKKSLTTWILVAMAVGVEIGLDFPAFSQNLQFLSKSCW